MSPASDTGPFRCTAEHLHARCKGGKDVLQNIVAACWLCNSRRHRLKAPLAPEDYKKYVPTQLENGRWTVFESNGRLEVRRNSRREQRLCHLPPNLAIRGQGFGVKPSAVRPERPRGIAFQRHLEDRVFTQPRARSCPTILRWVRGYSTTNAAFVSRANPRGRQCAGIPTFHRIQ